VGADGRCPTYSHLEICSGEVPSFDGARIDVDVTLPAGPRPKRGYPLLVMVHGAAGVDGSKREFESVTDEANGGDRYRWNTNWFARHGFYVLTFSQRLPHRPSRGGAPPEHAAWQRISVPCGKRCPSCIRRPGSAGW